MPEFMTAGQVAKTLNIPLHKLQYSIRLAGAPEPKAGKVSNRWLFSAADVEALREWFASRGKAVAHA